LVFGFRKIVTVGTMLSFPVEHLLDVSSISG